VVRGRCQSVAVPRLRWWLQTWVRSGGPTIVDRVRTKLWIWFKLLLQASGIPRSPTLFYPSVTRGWRYPTFLYQALRASEIIECRRPDLPFFLLHGSISDFLFRVRSIGPEEQPRAPRILAEPIDDTSGFSARILIHHNAYVSHLGHDAVTAPYFVHPVLVQGGWTTRFTRHRRGVRDIRVVFAGAEGPQYDAISYPLMSRHRVLHALRNFRPAPIVVVQRKELCTLRDAAMVLVMAGGSIDDRECPPLLSPTEYLALLGRSDFAIAPPGLVMPHSHNVIEAMAVGCIPILNYPELFQPVLQDGINCLAFMEEQELQQQVRRALSMSSTEVARMRQEVIHYYESVLAPAAFGRRLQQVDGPLIHLHVNGELGRSRDTLS
jgi:hypothetical protein